MAMLAVKLRKKFKIKSLPALLIGSRGDPEKLWVFQAPPTTQRYTSRIATTATNISMRRSSVVWARGCAMHGWVESIKARVGEGQGEVGRVGGRRGI